MPEKPLKPKTTLLLTLTLAVCLASGCVHRSTSPPLAEKRLSGKPIFIENATVFTGDPHRPFLENTSIFIKNGKILRMGDFPPPLEICDRINGADKMVIPGLIDHHVHLYSPGAPPGFSVMPDDALVDRNLSAYLYAGVTTVFDMTAPLPEMAMMSRRVKESGRVNPRVFYVGKCLNVSGGHPDYMLRSMIPWPVDVVTIGKVMAPVSDAADAKAAVHYNREQGASLTKIMIDQIPLGVPSLREELTADIVKASAAEGLKVGSHIGSEADILTGLRGGVRFFCHAPYRSSLSDATIGEMKAAGAVVIPTLVVFDQTADFFRRSIAFTDMDKRILDPKILEAYDVIKPEKRDLKDPRLESWVHDLVIHRDIKFDNVRRMKAAGIDIIAGTDSPNVATAPGSSIHTELRLLVTKCGFTPEEAVMAATGRSGNWLETLTGVKGLGRIAVNGPADLVVLNGDFRKDIRQTENIHLVISDGRVVDRRAGETAKPQK